MDFEEFEQLVLKVLFETEVPVTSAHIAYLGHISVRTADRHLAHMVEQGTLLVRTSTDGVIEYYYPGRKPLAVATATMTVGPPAIEIGDPFLVPDTSIPAGPAAASRGWRRPSWATRAASSPASSSTDFA